MREDVYGYKSSINVYNVDMNRKARPAGLLREMQECGSRQMADQRPSYDELLDKGQALMLSRLDMIIPQEVSLDEEIEVFTWPCPSVRATFLRNYLVRKNGETAAMISSQWTLVNSETRKIMKVDEVDFSNYTMDEYVDVMPGSKFKISREDGETMEASEPVGVKTVKLSDVDYNGHMNNTNYVDMLCDYIPELAAGTHRVTVMRIHFSKEAPLGETIEIKRLKTPDDKYLFRTFRSDGELNVEAEFTLEKLNG
ncbi:MAG: acyl-[acyl-carrier-protein] thioesterase [Anaerovoracaceae bacterium]